MITPRRMKLLALAILPGFAISFMDVSASAAAVVGHLTSGRRLQGDDEATATTTTTTATTTPCTLCYGGASHDTSILGGEAWIAGIGYTSCENAASLAPDVAEGTADCLITQLSGTAYCGCPDLPAAVATAINGTCQFCSNGAFDYNDLSLTLLVPQFPLLSAEDPSNNDTTSPEVRPVTCLDMILQVSTYSEDLCQANTWHSVQYFCGCPEATPPRDCFLCSETSTLDEFAKVPGGTCQDLQDVIENGITDQCEEIQSVSTKADCCRPINNNITENDTTSPENESVEGGTSPPSSMARRMDWSVNRHHYYYYFVEVLSVTILLAVVNM